MARFETERPLRLRRVVGRRCLIAAEKSVTRFQRPRMADARRPLSGAFKDKEKEPLNPCHHVRRVRARPGYSQYCHCPLAIT
jgi:hypothetical protein